jgi:hypothetical protein
MLIFFGEVYGIRASASLREFEADRRDALSRDSAAVWRDSLCFDFWRWTLAFVGVTRQR